MVAAGLQSSKGEARRLIKNRGANVNNAKVPAVDAVVGVADVIDGRLLLLGAGKENKMLVWVVPSIAHGDDCEHLWVVRDMRAPVGWAGGDPQGARGLPLGTGPRAAAAETVSDLSPK
ncbi:hypothetical protein I4F81_011125 [Pyropia yezoensis]|uniref:Uncharacterized protein n=1 Tax=Pyropia yezoensis TaxID=2788 RepID=A0ACC3CFC1_PYRYE|nr:hypothetical protein I4F81_011125 [Neopyropia yezoensis]